MFGIAIFCDPPAAKDLGFFLVLLVGKSGFSRPAGFGHVFESRRRVAGNVFFQSDSKNLDMDRKIGTTFCRGVTLRKGAKLARLLQNGTTFAGDSTKWSGNY